MKPNMLNIGWLAFSIAPNQVELMMTARQEMAKKLLPQYMYELNIGNDLSPNCLLATLKEKNIGIIDVGSLAFGQVLFLAECTDAVLIAPRFDELGRFQEYVNVREKIIGGAKK